MLWCKYIVVGDRDMIEPDLQDLLKHREWLERLASSLVDDPDDARDLVQQTWLAALQRPPRDRSLRGWLAGVLRNKALMLRRGKRRRVRAAAVDVRRETQKAVDVVERVELEQRLGRMVLQLDEPYRTCILLRFYQEMPPRDIAADQRVPVETVKTWLKRGLGLLRGRLHQDRGGAWRASLAPLLGIAVKATVGIRPMAATSVSGMGALLMLSKTTLVACAAVLLGLIGYWSWSSEDTSDAGRPKDPATTDAGEGSADGRRTPREPASPSPVDTHPYREPTRAHDALPAKPTTRWVLAGVLLGRAHGPPVSAGVEVKPLASDWRVRLPEGVAAGFTNEDARFEIDVTDLVTDAVGEFEVTADHPAYLPASGKVRVSQAIAESGSRCLRVRIELKGARSFTGRVVDANGEPVAGARVAALLATRDSEWRKEVDLATTDAEGAYRVRTGLDGTWYVAAVAPDRVPASYRVDAATTETTLPDLVLTDGVAIRGTVSLAGEPVPRAVVAARRRADGSVTVGGRSFRFQEDRFCRGTATAVCDDRGQFQISGLLPGTFDLAVRQIPGCALHMAIGANAKTRVTAPARDVVLDLESARIDVFVRHEGASVAGLGMMMSGDGMVGRKSDSNGKAGFLVKPGETYRIVIGDKAYEPVEKEVVAPGAGETLVESVELQPRRERPSLLVTFRTPAGIPLARAGFGFYEEDHPSSLRFWRDVVAKDGRFLVGELRPGRWRVVCRPGGWAVSHEHLLDAETTVDVPEHGSVTTAVSTRPGGRLRIVVRDPQGRPVQARCRLMQGSVIVPATFHTRSSDGGSYSMSGYGTGAGVCDVLRALPAGKYRIAFTNERYREHVVDVVIESGETTEVDVTLVPMGR